MKSAGYRFFRSVDHRTAKSNPTAGLVGVCCVPHGIAHRPPGRVCPLCHATAYMAKRITDIRKARA